MRLDTVIRRMPGWYDARISVHLRSSPGRGKTTTFLRFPEIVGKHTGKRLGISIINGAMLTPMDVLGYGLPKHSENHSEMVFSDPFFWRTQGSGEGPGNRLEEYDGGVVFVDEADKADVDVKKVLGEGAESGRFGPHKLPPGWIVWTAGNSIKDRSGSTKELDHLINRRMEIDVTDDLNSWNNWADENGVSPIFKAFANQHPQIVFSEGVPEKQGPWCTPRSGVKADRYLQTISGGGSYPDDEEAIEEVTGLMGAAAAVQFFAFVKLDREMPKYETIVKDPMKVPVPEAPDARMLVVYNLAHRVAIKEIDPVIKYVERMPKEFAMIFARASCKREAKIAATAGMGAWAGRNASLMAAINNLK
jgi:hypothetical protein